MNPKQISLIVNELCKKKQNKVTVENIKTIEVGVKENKDGYNAADIELYKKLYGPNWKSVIDNKFIK